jgi:hypothetical protein
MFGHAAFGSIPFADAASEDQPQAPIGQLNWPNPRGYVASIALRTHLDAPRLPAGLDQFFTSPGRPPVYDWPNPRGYIPAISLRTHVDPLRLNLLGADIFFGGPGQSPPQRDWPNPRGYIPAISLRTHIDPLRLNLRGKDQFFTSPGRPPVYDWPNPRGYVASISLRTHLLRHQFAEVVAMFAWEGSATMEFVGTTRFIDDVESGDVEFAYGAEINLRSL